MKALIYGNLTLDENITDGKKYQGPGGSSYFISRTYDKLGVESTLVSPYGFDFPNKYLQDFSVFPPKPIVDSTLIFQNITKASRRVQKVFNIKHSPNILPEKIPKSLLNHINLVIFATVLDNISPATISKIKNFVKPDAIISLVAQGLFRNIDENGNVVKKEKKNIEAYLKYIDFMFLSVEDIGDSLSKAEKWSRGGPLVIVTQAEKGCMIFNHGKPQKFNAFKIDNIIDATGAGDVFAAAFSYAYFQTKNISYCAKFGNSAAALSLKSHSSDLKFTLQDIENLIDH
ncbi:hypothetical protein A2773_02880 [Candidatus Gottesmanbacteria bacterium RIFCSPHIGHO2_01_FULL_39_10]|uniref:Carbohydrate kinase PfkB domain-containing protein n=1 Tax=Candidatus Gottesmanbacteria bacterium RIFCSPHIGHO2_01_FULL_39_10 TaxID=1798375 RepID=A0A1F5ZPI8_9BACT|nr:MAG: hypothetical protein A2773_02880 [Candidatus Gottesmanbacteria bacterium RIFCSPHIGHO2_01_FULL_39_10]